MNCTRYLRTAIQRPIAVPFRRNITTTPCLSATAAPRQGNPNSSAHTPSAATSTGAAQPFSTPLSSSPSAAELQAPSAEKQAPTVKSSVAAGTPLKGLNFVKGKNDPVALEDGEYPAWLWGILKKKGGESADGAASVEGDLFCMSFFLVPVTLSLAYLPLFPPLLSSEAPSLTLLSSQPNPRNNVVWPQKPSANNNYSTRKPSPQRFLSMNKPLICPLETEACRVLLRPWKQETR